MKKHCIYIIMIFVLLLMPKMVYADGLYGICDYKDLSDYRALANNVNITYSYDMVKGEPIFSITLTNLSEYMYVTDVYRNKTYYNSNFTKENELTLTGYTNNQKVKLQIYTRDGGCSDQLLTTKYITIPAYNKFYSDEVCDGVEEYSLCQRWAAVSIDYDEFVAKVTEYKEKKFAREEAINFKNKETLLEKIFTFVGEYYAILVCGVIVIVLIIGAIQKIFLKKNQFDFKV